MRLLSNSLPVLFIAIIVVCVSQPITAQQRQIETLAQQTADELSHANLKSVVVFDFVGPDEMDALGKKLADEFRAALAESANAVQIEDRSKILELLKKNDLVPANLHDFIVQRWLSGQTDADAWISGTISKSIGGPKLTVQAFCVKSSCEQFYELNTFIPLTEYLEGLISEKANEPDEFSNVPREWEGGYSGPACIYCPVARFTAEALKRGIRGGTVLLDITVDTEGHAKDIRVKVGLPYGLTQQAIEAVREWRLKPATGPDGKPAAVRATIQVVFVTS